MNTRFKVFASYNILQYLCDFIHVLIFVTVSKCRKSPKLTNIVSTFTYCRFWAEIMNSFGPLVRRLCHVVPHSGLEPDSGIPHAAGIPVVGG
jgi:hypothetical protein